MKLSHLSFPELRLPTREAQHLRGYFGELFKEHSPLLHNHLESGEFRYGYPLVQYKIIEGVPVLLGLGEGAPLLVELFMKVKELNLHGINYPLQEKQVACREAGIGYLDHLQRYAFQTLWMPLNQANYANFQQLAESEQRPELERLLRGNILSMLKGLGIWLEPQQRVMCSIEHFSPRTVNFKNQPMLAFQARFAANVELPQWIGLGKAVSRGFGAVNSI